MSLVKCPTCGQKGDWFAARYGPFCSRRCKLLDLGKWFGEEHSIPGPLGPDELEELMDEPQVDPVEDEQPKQEP